MLRNAFELKFGGDARNWQRSIAFKSDALNTKGRLDEIHSEVASAIDTTLAPPHTFRRISRNRQTRACGVVVATETIQSQLQAACAAEVKSDALPGFQ